METNKADRPMKILSLENIFLEDLYNLDSRKRKKNKKKLILSKGFMIIFHLLWPKMTTENPRKNLQKMCAFKKRSQSLKNHNNNYHWFNKNL